MFRPIGFLALAAGLCVAWAAAAHADQQGGAQAGGFQQGGAQAGGFQQGGAQPGGFQQGGAHQMQRPQMQRQQMQPQQRQQQMQPQQQRQQQMRQQQTRQPSKMHQGKRLQDKQPLSTGPSATTTGTSQPDGGYRFRVEHPGFLGFGGNSNYPNDYYRTKHDAQQALQATHPGYRGSGWWKPRIVPIPPKSKR